MADKPGKKDSGPKPPPAKQHFPSAVISFVSGPDAVTTIGDLNKHGDADVQAAFTSKHTGTDLPYLGFRIKLRRDESTKHLYDADHEDYHTMTFKYHHDQYDIDHHRASKAEQASFLTLSGNSPSAKKACDNDKLYVVKFSLGGKEGPEVHGHGSALDPANAYVNDIYNQLFALTSAQVVNVYLWEYKSLPSQLEWSIDDQATRSDPLLHYYHTSQKTSTPQGYVQWGRLRERDINMDKPFERRLGCHDFDNFVVLYGNSEAYEAKYFFDLGTQMRATQAKMSVFAPPGSNGDYYIGFVWVHDWETFQHIFAPLDDLFITLEPPPEIKPQSEKADGEKDPRDTAPGWSARVMEDNALFQDAPLTIMLRRPREGSPLSEMKMPAATSVDEDMPTINVYVKTFPSAVTVKARLKALDKHRFRNNKTAPFDEKRRLLVGRDLSVTSHVDLLQGIPEAQVEEMIAKLNSSQRECILTHCRNVRNGVNLIHGPFGSGKTVLVALLCKLQSVRVPGSKTFVACSSNSACDAVVPKLTNSNLMVVRAHALSLERETRLKDYHAKQRSGKLRKADPLPDDYVPPVRPQKVQPALEIEGAEMIQGGVDGDEEDANQSDDNATHPGYELDGEAEKFDEQSQGGQADGFREDAAFDELMLKASLYLLKLSEQRYNERMAIFNPEDPRMVCLEVAIHTWVLKFSGIVDSKWSTKPTPEEVAAGKSDPWLEFRALYHKADRQHLNDLEWTKFKNLLTKLSQAVLRAGDVIIATAVQGETDLLKNINFEQIIMDEISVATHAELLCCWRETEVLTIIGDGKQLPATVLTTAAQNPFVNVQSFGPFQRFSELGMPVFLLKEVMRMSVGLEDVANTIFYDSKLISGPGTSLDDPKRAMSRRLRPFLRDTFPKLAPEPEGLTYPIFFDVRGTCVKEQSGSSRVNFHNVSFVIGLIQKLLAKKKLRLRSSEIGIACPYAAQRRETRKGLSRAGIHDIRVGTSGFWQGKEAAVMIVDFVRAGNDNGSLGFLVKKERLNVLLSRQEQHLFVVGDITCCHTDFAAALNPSVEASDPTTAIADPLTDENPAADTPATLDRRNAWVIKVLKWFQEHGRVSNVDMEEITEDYVTFPKEEEQQEEVDLGGWGDADEE